MFSLYSSAFNLKNSGLDWKNAIDNFCAFARQVVVAVNDNESDALLNDYKKSQGMRLDNLKLVQTFYDIQKDIAADGKMKNAALRECTEKLCIGLDLDERVRLRDKKSWEHFGDLIYTSKF